MRLRLRTGTIMANVVNLMLTLKNIISVTFIWIYFCLVNFHQGEKHDSIMFFVGIRNLCLCWFICVNRPKEFFCVFAILNECVHLLLDCR